ncbi:MAG: hypothetical protein AB7U61_05965 [Methylocystis sp.]
MKTILHPMHLPLPPIELALTPNDASMRRGAHVMEDMMISAREHMTMAAVGAIVGAALGAGIGGALFGLPGILSAAVLGGIGGAIFGSFL